MRLHVLSDLHADIAGNAWSPQTFTDADVVVCAGDTVAPMTLGLRWLRASFPGQRVLYVPGNHCYYSHFIEHRPELKTTYEDQRRRAPELARELGIDLLDDAEVLIDNVRFLGSTLWTDFQQRPGYLMFGDAVREAEKRHNDYRKIKVDPGRSRNKFTAAHSIAAHRKARVFLRDALARPFAGDTVVVTHHAPSPRSLHPAVGDMDWLYASNLEALMDGDTAPALWIHGHIHRNVDYVVGATRVLANPRGYPNEPQLIAEHGPRENPDFDPALVVEVGLQPLPILGI
jgi:hypothetical protein